MAHVSDLHVGRDASTDEAARRLAAALAGARVDAVLLTGDVTHRGLASELARFEAIFRPLIDAGRLAIVPGNHDRMGDDAGRALMRGGRVAVAGFDGLHVVRVDSTAPHNRSLVDGHGALSAQDVADVVQAVAMAPAGSLPVVMLHHHVLPLPVEDLAERLATLVGLPCADELPLGEDLLGQVLGRCRLVLHGHRHVPSEFRVELPGVPSLRILNAGSTTLLGRARLFAHAGGQIAWEGWLSTESVAPRAWRPPAAATGGVLAVA
ncbi:MAG TPA: metallophosphoesterase [Anaeromyxobacteraceae bacterium]|nr:metallophosphoesterase [Anaeromyxobacteraceae bacterium]